MRSKDDLFKGLGVRVKLNDPDDFPKIRETLERIGICTVKDGVKTLWQSCHILHKRGQYAIMLFFELFEMDGRLANYKKDDILRRNLIVTRLEEWGLLEIIDKELIIEMASQSSITIIPYEDRLNGSVRFVQKYKIGKNYNG